MGSDEEIPPATERTATPAANASSHQLLVNIATGYLGLGVSLAMSFLLTPITLHYLGASGYGLWIVLVSLGTYITILDGGISTATIQLVASYLALHEEDKVADLMATARAFFVSTALGAVAIALLAMPFLGQLINVPSDALHTAKIGLVLVGVLTGVGFLNNVPQCLLYGSGRNDRASLIGTAMAVLTQGAQIAAVFLGGGLVGLLAASVGGAALSYAITERVARRMGLLRLGHGRPRWPIMRELLTSGRRNVTVALGGTVAYGLDTIVIGAILPVRQVAPYDLALSTSNFSQSLSTSATNVLLPTYAHSHALDDRDRQFNLYSRAVLASLSIMGPITVALVAYGQPLLDLWLRTVPKNTYEILVALNLALLGQLPGVQSYMFLTGVGRNRIIARITLPAAIANLGLSIGATFWLGPVGPVIGSIPQVVILDFLILPAMCCHVMGVSIWRYTREALLPVTVPLAAAAVVAVVLRLLIGDSSEAAAPFASVAITLLAWAALVPVLLRTDPLVRRVAQRLLSRIRPSAE